MYHLKFGISSIIPVLYQVLKTTAFHKSLSASTPAAKLFGCNGAVFCEITVWKEELLEHGRRQSALHTDRLNDRSPA